MRILIVEDDLRLAGLIKRGLEAEGFDTELAHDGHTGLRQARQGNHDAIMLDVMLPGLSGHAVCRQLRHDRLDTPILMLTARDGEYDEADGLDEGADDYMTKPFSYVVLAARLRALIRRGGRARPKILRLGEVTVDLTAARCLRAGREITLTAKEFAILEYLAGRSGEAVSKRDILDQVWDIAFEGEPNIVEVYISSIRRKIGRMAIETVRGVGYRLADQRP
ncbi:response regulator transcription factor [Spongiactinospora sp. 9N601]|uniref:response regulator transcription factor n=1 Tax=Spongiactinospora sp. 9N601 TaxID=3375149 RepID=UPI0037A1A1E7